MAEKDWTESCDRLVNKSNTRAELTDKKLSGKHDKKKDQTHFVDCIDKSKIELV